MEPTKPRARDIVSVLEECLWRVDLARAIHKTLESVKPAVRQFTQAISTSVVPAMVQFGKAMQQAMDKAVADMALPPELLKDEKETEESDG